MPKSKKITYGKGRFKVTKFTPINDNDNSNKPNKTKKKLGKSPLSKVMSMSDMPQASESLVNNNTPRGKFTVKSVNKTPAKSRFTVKSANKTPPKSRFTIANVNETPPKSRFTVADVNETPPKSRFTVVNVNETPPKSRFTVTEVNQSPPKSRFTLEPVNMDEELESINQNLEVNKRLTLNKVFKDILRPHKLQNPFQDLGLSEKKIIRFNNGVGFELVKKIGDGGQGQVWLGKMLDIYSLNNELYQKMYHQNQSLFFALKFMKLHNKRDISNFTKEIKNLRKLTIDAIKDQQTEISSHNFAKLYFSDNSGKTYIMCSEFVNGRTLSFRKNKEVRNHVVISKDKGVTFYLKIFEQLINGINYIHNHNVVHRDIKPDNIIISDIAYDYIDDSRIPITVPLIKFVDFGLSCGHYETNECLYDGENSIVGTEGFIDPSLYTGISKTFEEAKKSDIYSLGMTMFMVLHNFHLLNIPEFLDYPAGIRYRMVREYLPIKSYYRVYLGRKEYEILDFIVNICLENDVRFRFSSDKLASIFKGTYQYIRYIPGIEHISKINGFDLEDIDDSECACSDLVLDDSDCQFNIKFIEKDLKCQHKCSHSDDWIQNCNTYIASVSHSLLNALDDYPDIDFTNWLLLVKNQHEASYVESKNNYPKQTNIMESYAVN